MVFQREKIFITVLLFLNGLNNNSFSQNRQFQINIGHPLLISVNSLSHQYYSEGKLELKYIRKIKNNFSFNASGFLSNYFFRASSFWNSPYHNFDVYLFGFTGGINIPIKIEEKNRIIIGINLGFSWLHIESYFYDTPITSKGYFLFSPGFQVPLIKLNKWEVLFSSSYYLFFGNYFKEINRDDNLFYSIKDDSYYEESTYIDYITLMLGVSYYF